MRTKKTTGMDGEEISIPIADTPSGTKHPIMIGVIVATIIVFMLQFCTTLEWQRIWLMFQFNSFLSGSYWTIITAQFAHYPPQLNLYVAIIHIGFNLWFLYLFFNNSLDRIGWKALVIFLTGGILSFLVFGFVYPDTFLMGISGCVSASLGMYFVLFPNNTVSLICIKSKHLQDIHSVEDVIKLKKHIYFREVKASKYILGWFIVQVGFVTGEHYSEIDGVVPAYLCHVVAWLIGAGLAYLYIKIGKK